MKKRKASSRRSCRKCRRTRSNHELTRIDTNWEEASDVDKLLFRAEVFQIVACAIEVLNTLGHGLIEKPYENALVVEFGLREIPFRQQPPFDVLYKGRKVGLFIPDLIAFDAIVVDTKVIDRITDHERGVMLNYLRITTLRVGVILNFKHRKLEWQRIAL
jgi:GxxExxY protein